jgi:carbon monoxide dehydrogenase subunit G
MTTVVERSVVVDVPVSVAYAQWTQFEEFPQFMSGVRSVTQLTDERLQWVAEIAGVRREWEARSLEQVPDRKVAWAATQGATNAGSVTFEPAGPTSTHVHLHLEYEPEGLVEKVGDRLDIVEKQAEGDLERFKAFIESEGHATGAWRGSVNEGVDVRPTTADAAMTGSDSGKAGVSGKVAAAVGLGVAAAAAGVVAAARKDGSPELPPEPAATTADVPVVDTVPVVADVEPVSPAVDQQPPAFAPVALAAESGETPTWTGPETPAWDPVEAPAANDHVLLDADDANPEVEDPTPPLGSGLEGDPLIVVDDTPGDHGARL